MTQITNMTLRWLLTDAGRNVPLAVRAEDRILFGASRAPLWSRR